MFHRFAFLLALAFFTVASAQSEAALIDPTIRQRYAEWDLRLGNQSAAAKDSNDRIGLLKEIASRTIIDKGLDAETKNERLFFVFERLYKENPGECLSILEHIINSTGKLWLKLYSLKNQGQVQWITGEHKSALQSFQRIIDLVKEHHSPRAKLNDVTGIPEFEYRVVHAYGMVIHLAQTLNDSALATATAHEYATSVFTNDLKQMAGVGASVGRNAAIALRRAGNEKLARSLFARIPSDSGMYDANPKMRVVVAVEGMGYAQEEILVRSGKLRELWNKPDYYEIPELDSYCAAHFQDLVKYAESGIAPSNIWPHVLEFGDWYVAAMKKKALISPKTYSKDERALAKELWRANLGTLSRLRYKHGNVAQAKELSTEYLKHHPRGGQRRMAEFIVSSKKDDDSPPMSRSQRLIVRLIIAIFAALGLFLLIRMAIRRKADLNKLPIM